MPIFPATTSKWIAFCSVTPSGCLFLSLFLNIIRAIRYIYVAAYTFFLIFENWAISFKKKKKNLLNNFEPEICQNPKQLEAQLQNEVVYKKTRVFRNIRILFLFCIEIIFLCLLLYGFSWRHTAKT